MVKHYIENSNTTGHAYFPDMQNTNRDMGLLHNIVYAILQKSKSMLYIQIYNIFMSTGKEH